MEKQCLKCPKCGHILMECEGNAEIFISGAINISCLKCDEKIAQKKENQSIDFQDPDLRGKR